MAKAVMRPAAPERYGSAIVRAYGARCCFPRGCRKKPARKRRWPPAQTGLRATLRVAAASAAAAGPDVMAEFTPP